MRCTSPRSCIRSHPRRHRCGALRALLILQHSRRDAREHNGELVTLADQDRTTWHHDEIRVGLELLATLPPGDGYAEQLRIQAQIAALHGTAGAAADTDWTAIAGHYATLETLTGSSIVRLNRAVAVAEAQSPEAGLAILAGIHDVLRDHHRFAAVCGELASRAGDIDLAIASYQAALELCGNEAETAHIRSRLVAVQARG